MKILVIDCHNRENSLCTALAESYRKGAIDAGNELKLLNLRDLNMEEYLRYGHDQKYEPVGDVLNAQHLISWSDHLLFVYPTWWAGLPALLRLFFEMVFSPGFAFKYHERLGKLVSWDKLLKGKSARIIATMDAPPWYYKWIMGDPGGKIIRQGILGFTGVKPIKTTYFGSVKLSSAKQREKWLDLAYFLGKTDKKLH
ncbi:MAG: NAD(P)H-dependent oxidoreductase [Chitinophagales bacterium]|jgi:putative NADPH-quinone reductase